MLPILRILPVGGVLLAIMLLALALNPPAGPHAPLTPDGAPARGAMIDQGEHPEWRQLLMQAAIQRADELNRLRELPDTPTRTETAPPAAPQVAGLPTEHVDSDPDDDDQTGSIVQPPAATFPVEIGETSTFELPMVAPEEQPPVTRTPQRVKSRNESRLKGARHGRRARALAKPKPPVPFDLFKAMFGEQKFTTPATLGAHTVTR